MRKKKAIPEGKKTLTRIILKKVFDIGEVTLDAFFPPNYCETRIWRKLLGLDPSYQFSPRTFSAILSRLRRQGLVAKQGNNRRARWRLTQRGKELFQEDKFLPPVDRIPRLVVFDVPEAERKKRDAIRRELITCEFEPLQKSVWVGYRPLPRDFMELLDLLEMKNYVHIFSIQKLGTIGEA